MLIPTYEAMFKQIRINFWLSGIPFDDKKINLRFFFLCFILVLMIVEESSFFVFKISSENFLELTQLTPCLAIGTMSFLKICSLTIKRHKIFVLTQNLKILYEGILNNPKKKKIIEQDMIRITLLLKYYFVLNAILISVYNFSSPLIMLYNYLVRKPAIFILPYAVLVPFSIDTWYKWFVVYCQSISAGFICVLFFTTLDSLYCILTCHICSNYMVLSNDIQSLDKPDVSELKKIVHLHQYISKLAQDLEEIFTVPNLYNVLVGSLEVCALGFNLTTGDWSKIPGCILFLFSVLLRIFMMSVFGQYLIKQSETVGESAYKCNWVNMDQNSKKIILNIMIRSQKAQRMTAYKFTIISHNSLTKIVSTAWSYFTLLRTVYTPPEVP